MLISVYLLLPRGIFLHPCNVIWKTKFTFLIEDHAKSCKNMLSFVECNQIKTLICKNPL